MALSQSVALDTLNNTPPWTYLNERRRTSMSMKLEPLTLLNNSNSDVKVRHINSRIYMAENETSKNDSFEKAISFLKEQHLGVLSSLHQEVDTLKKQNRELQLKITMFQDPGCKAPHDTEDSSLSPVHLDKKCQTDTKEDEALHSHVKLLEDQIKKLKDALKKEKLKSTEVTDELEIEKKKFKMLEQQTRKTSEKDNIDEITEVKPQNLAGLHKPINLSHSLPPIVKNQLVSRNSIDTFPKRIHQIIEKQDSEPLVTNFKISEIEKSPKSCENEIKPFLSARISKKISGPSQHFFSIQPFAKKSASTLQMPKINLDFTENSNSDTKQKNSKSASKSKRKKAL